MADNSIGRITTIGSGHQLHRARHQRSRRASPPAPTGRCGSPTETTTRSGGSPPPGWSPTTPAPASDEPCGYHGRPRRGAVVHQPRQQLDRADHHRRSGDQLHRPRHPRTRKGSRPVPTGPCGSPMPATTRSGGSPPPGWSRTTPGPGSSTPWGITAGPDGALWFTNYEQQLDRADHHRRGGQPLHRQRASAIPAGITAGPDGALWFTDRRDRLDRADHHRWESRRSTPGSGISNPQGIAAGPDGALWFTNDGNASIGRITTS